MGAGVVRVKGTHARAGDVGRRQRPLRLPRSVRRRAARGRRGVAQRRLRRRPADRRDQLPELRQSREARDHVAVRARRSKASAPRAARSTFRSPAATSASTTRPTAARVLPTPVLGVVGLIEDADAVVAAGVPRRRRRRRPARRRAATSSAAASTCKVDARPRCAACRRRSIWRARRRCSGCSSTARRPGSSGRRTTAPKAASRSRWPSAASTRRSASTSIVAGGRQRQSGFGDIATLFGESASRVVVSVAAGAQRPSCWRWPRRAGVPAASIGDVGGDRIRIVGRRAHGRRRAAGRCGADLVDGDRAVLRATPRDCVKPYTGSCRGTSMFDKFRDECGVFGIFGHPEAANLTYLGLYALQHRGQESAGIAASDGVQICASRRRWATSTTRSTARRSSKLPGHAWPIGHVRYSTAGESRLANAQPIVVDCVHGQLAIGHNGNLVNAGELRDALVRAGRDLPDHQRHRSRRPPVRALAGATARRRRSSTRCRRCAARSRS